MRIVLTYITVTGGVRTAEFASRFVGSYFANPPEVPHLSYIACNGGPPSSELGTIFAPFEGWFWPRENSPGFDISAYIEAANTFPCDMLVCLGESVWFYRPGWLKRIVEAWTKYGPGMYGFWASNMVRPHLMTTGFVVDPKLLRGWPWPRDRRERYEFEHGERSFWRRVRSLGKPVKLVTWDGEYGPEVWRSPHNCLWRGDQSNCLAFCSHTDRFENADLNTKGMWASKADAPFK